MSYFYGRQMACPYRLSVQLRIMGLTAGVSGINTRGLHMT